MSGSSGTVGGEAILSIQNSAAYKGVSALSSTPLNGQYQLAVSGVTPVSGDLSVQTIADLQAGTIISPVLSLQSSVASVTITVPVNGLRLKCTYIGG